MHELVQTVFSRLSQLDPTEAERQLKEEEESEKGELKMSIKGSQGTPSRQSIDETPGSSPQENLAPSDAEVPIFDDAVLVDKARMLKKIILVSPTLSIHSTSYVLFSPTLRPALDP